MFRLAIIFSLFSVVLSFVFKIVSTFLFSAILLLGFKLLAGALSSCAFIGVAIGVGLVFASLVYSIARNPAQKNELLRYAFIGFSLVEASGMIGLVFGFVLLFGF